MVVLREILMSSVRAGDPLAAWSAAARLLRSFYPLITPAGQSGLASSLAKSAERLPPGTRCADPALPFIRHLQALLILDKLYISFLFSSKQFYSMQVFYFIFTFLKTNLGFMFLLSFFFLD